MKYLLKNRIASLLIIGVLFLTVSVFFFFTDFNPKKLNPFIKPKITIVSGVYIKGKFLDGKVEHHYSGEAAPPSNEGDIEVLLRDKRNNTLAKSKVTSIFSMEILSSAGAKHIDSRDMVPVLVVFPYTQKAVEAVVIRNGKVLFSQKY